jgi:hypothetical protein
MVIYLFRDESSTDVFALSDGVAGHNIPPITPHTEWVFLEALDTVGKSKTFKRCSIT